MSTLALDERQAARLDPTPRAGARLFLRRLLRTRLVGPSLVVILVLVMYALFPRQFAPYDPVTDQSYSETNQGPSLRHIFGTDYIGRDIYSPNRGRRRISILVGVISVGIGLLVGVSIGVLGGYVGGWVDTVVMRLSDVIWAFPALILALAITAALGSGIGNAMIAIGVLNVPFFARLARGSTLSAREMEYVLAARTIGGARRGSCCGTSYRTSPRR